MIVEHHEDIPDEYRVSVPTVHPWTAYPVCEKCGGSLGAGLPVVRRLMAAFGRSAQSYGYCKGDQNSQVQVPAMNIATGNLGVMPVNVPCFGVYKEHLHCKCGWCGFDWLMEVKGEIKP